MDPTSSDLEFLDFKNASEEEIKEIQAILKGPMSNCSLELPWEFPLKENCNDDPLVQDGETESQPSKSSKEIGTVVGQALQFVGPNPPSAPTIAQLPQPAVETFVTLPTTVGPYQNAPYFVSRTIPYLRAYPHMGVPFFACPMPGAGEANPYGQFVPVVPATVGQEKFINQTENESNHKNQEAVGRQNKKKLSNSENDSFEPENGTYREHSLGEVRTQTSPLPSSLNSGRPTSVPLVPLSVPPSTFAVAGSTLPLHGYPPGLHTLPYPQMSGPQAQPPAMYYVPVFNHPYGSYLPSPQSGAMVLPINLRPETEINERVVNKCSKIDDGCTEEVPVGDSSSQVVPTSPTVSCESFSNVQSNCETPSPKQGGEGVHVEDDQAAKNTCSSEEKTTDCNSPSDPLSKTASPSPDYVPETVDKCGYSGCQPVSEEMKEAVRDPSRCWADLFKKPCSEVNGIDCQTLTQHKHRNKSILKKDIANGKINSVPASDGIH